MTAMSEAQARTETASSPALDAAMDAAAQAVAVHAAALAELGPSAAGGGGSVGIERLLDVPVAITVEVGRAQITLGELVQLGPGSLVALEREAHEPADILVNGKVVARGEIVTIGAHYGVRITTVMSAT